MSKFNKFFDKFIYIFLLVISILNIFTNSLIKNNNYPMSISFIVFFISFIIFYILLFKNYKIQKIFLYYIGIYKLLFEVFIFELSFN